MKAFPVEPTKRTSIRAVLIAGAGAVGLAGATELLDQLPTLRCPVIVSLRGVESGTPGPGRGDIDRLHARIDGLSTRWATHGAALDAATVWIAPADRHTYVRDGHFELSDSASTSPAETPSLGKLYHSLRVEFGSRVFAVVIDESEPNSPTLRLLAQRGARVVSPLDCGPDDIARHWSSRRIVDHLSDALAIPSNDAVAIA